MLWLLALVGLAVVGWIWWQSGQGSAPVTKREARPVPPPFQSVPKGKPALPNKQPQTPPVVPVPAPQPSANANVQAAPPGGFPHPVQNVFEAQLALARQGISPGSLDGLIGSQTRSALRAFQQKERLPTTGELDATTRERLLLITPPYIAYTVTSYDLARLQPLSRTWLGKSQQTALDYETLLELVSEKSQSHPNLIRQLNPAVDWGNVAPGTSLLVPDVTAADPGVKAAFVIISLSSKVLEAFDQHTNLLAHFPCSIAQRVEKRPIGELRVSVIISNPDYTFDPAVFPESAEALELGRKLVLPPGPNNPVGVAWIGLDKPGYGIHGTPGPEQVGRTESHGCFRLANWNAEYLVRLAWVGMPVWVEP